MFDQDIIVTDAASEYMILLHKHEVAESVVHLLSKLNLTDDEVTTLNNLISKGLENN